MRSCPVEIISEGFMKKVAFGDNNNGNDNRNKTKLTLIKQLHHTSHFPKHFIFGNLFRP